MSKTTQRIPASENWRGFEYTARSGNIYKVTRHIRFRRHYLWKVTEEGYEKLLEAETPYDLYAYIDKLEGLDTGL